MPMSNAAESLDRRDAVTQISELLAEAPRAEKKTGEPETGQPDLYDTLQPEGEPPTEADDSPETGEEAGEGEGPVPAQGEIQDLAGLAQAIGVEEQWLYNLKIPMPDGRDPITLGSFKDSITELDREKASIDRQRAQLQNLEQQIAAAMQMAQTVPQEVQNAYAEMQGIQAQYQGIDWDKFERKAPAQAALARQKLNDAYAAAQARFGEAQQLHQQASQKLHEQKRLAETSQLLEKVPEWKDRATAIRERDLIISTFATRYGVDPRETMMLNDHRYVRAMRDLSLLLQEKEGANAALKQVRKAPQTLRRIGNAVTRSSAQERKQAALTQRARELGTPASKRDAIANLLSLKGIT